MAGVAIPGADAAADTGLDTDPDRAPADQTGSRLHRWVHPAVRRLEQMPLRVRLVSILLCVLAVALVLLSITTAYLTKRDLLGRIDSELAVVAAPVANQAIDELRRASTVHTPSGYAFALMTPSGAPVYYSNPTGERLHPALPPIPLSDSRVRSGTPFTVNSTDGDLQWRFIAGAVGQDGTIAVGIPLRSMNQTMARLLVTSGLISALVLALCAVIGWYAVTRAFRPLRQIEDTASAIAKGDLTRRIPVREADDEVTSLAESLNGMLARIEKSFAVRAASEQRMREFVADASHELRTPLATVRGYAELHRQGALPEGEPTATAMGRIEAESRRMSGLVEDLLMLARLDDEPDVQGAEVDLTVLAADAVADARVRAPDRTIRLTGLDGPLAPVATWGVDSRLRQVITNILANALAHTPAGTPLEVRVGDEKREAGTTDAGKSQAGTTGAGKADAGKTDAGKAGASKTAAGKTEASTTEAVLEIADHGPGIPEADRRRVFDRFVRADPSRSRETGGGSGLGLAIVAAIVAAHHGRVGIQETPGGGATFVVHLPTQAPQQQSSKTPAKSPAKTPSKPVKTPPQTAPGGH